MGYAQLAVPVLTPPDRQQRAANAMPPGRGSTLPMANKAFLDNPDPVLIRPVPTAGTVTGGKNFDLRAVIEVGHNVGLTIGS
jgi:hypothetical protein